MSATTAEGTMPKVKKGAWSQTKARIKKAASTTVRVAKTAARKAVNGVARVVGGVGNAVLTVARVIVKIALAVVVTAAFLVITLLSALVSAVAAALFLALAWIDTWVIGTLDYMMRHGLINNVSYRGHLRRRRANRSLFNRFVESDTWKDIVAEVKETTETAEQAADEIVIPDAEPRKKSLREQYPDTVFDKNDQEVIDPMAGTEYRKKHPLVSASPQPLTPREEAVLANATFEIVMDIVKTLERTAGVEYHFVIEEDGHLEVEGLKKIDDQVFDMDTSSIVHNDDQRNYLLNFLWSIAGNAERPKQRGYAQGRAEALQKFIANPASVDDADRVFAAVWNEFKPKQAIFPHNVMRKGFYDQVEELKASAAVL